jgi:hypothetical protein
MTRRHGSGSYTCRRRGPGSLRGIFLRSLDTTAEQSVVSATSPFGQSEPAPNARQEIQRGGCTYSHAVTNTTIQLIECFPL